jgi:hypothetical protein
MVVFCEKNQLNCGFIKTKGSHNGNIWLSNIQIDHIMKQFEKKVNEFKYFGTISADHFKLHPKDISKIKKNESVGLIFNTDITKLPGKHWVAVFIKKNKVEYFDSNGEKPNKYISEFLKHFKNVELVNKKVIQHFNGDCGDFSMAFLMLRALHSSKIPLSDNIALHLRKVFFA